MQKSNRIISFLLCVLIVISGANLFLGVTNSYRIKQLESAPPVIIEELNESVAQVTEPLIEDITTTETVITTAENTTAAEAIVTESESAETEPSEKSTVTNPTSIEVPTTTKASVSESSPNESSNICYVTSSGTKYHRAGCSYLKKSKTQMTVSEAKSSGYSPCSRCY